MVLWPIIGYGVISQDVKTNYVGLGRSYNDLPVYNDSGDVPSHTGRAMKRNLALNN